MHAALSLGQAADVLPPVPALANLKAEPRPLIAHQSIGSIAVPELSTSYPQPVPAGRRAVTVWHTCGLRGTVRVFQAHMVSLGHSKKGGCG